MLRKGIIVCFILSLVIISSGAKAQHVNHHNVVWGRLALGDTINKRIRWEFYLQDRHQNTKDGSFNAFKAPQFKSYWLWFTYAFNPSLRLSISPFGFMKSWTLISYPNEVDRPEVNEFRWAVRLDQDQKFKRIVYGNRYSVEYRKRDLANNGEYLPNWRIRYQARIEKPLKFRGLNRPLSLVFSDEVMLQFGYAVRNNPNVFDQNRLYGGFTYGVAKNVKFSLGYIYQIQQRSSGKEFDQANILWGILAFDNVFSQFKKKPLPVSQP